MITLDCIALADLGLAKHGTDRIYANGAVEFLHEKTRINADTYSALPSKAKLFIIKYVELMQAGAGVSSENLAGLSQSFRNEDMNDLISDLARSILGDDYIEGTGVAVVPGVKKWR